MRVHLLGTRGSMPATGPDHVRYGGDTSCVAVSHDGEAPRLVLDAGTGLRRLETLLAGEAFRGSILLTHLHWDHVFGLPFCRSADHDDAEVVLHVPCGDDEDPVAALERQMSPPSFPIRPDELRGSWEFRSIGEGVHDLEGFEVTVREVAHKGGRTVGYRVQDATGAVGYLPDHDPLGVWADGAEGTRLAEGASAVARDVDVLLHDAQLAARDRPGLDHIGHATVDEAVSLAVASRVRRLVLFHHGPRRTDDDLDDLRDRLVAPLPVGLARDGDRFDVPAPTG